MRLIGRASPDRATSPGALRRAGVHLKWGRRQRRMGAELVADAEAFLSGRLVERAKVLGEEVPVWAWTNLLAHGGEKDLRAVSGELLSPWDWAIMPWREARSYLAAEVLRSAQHYGSLAELQELVLVPLELELARRNDVARWKPARWARVVEIVLTEECSGR